MITTRTPQRRTKRGVMGILLGCVALGVNALSSPPAGASAVAPRVEFSVATLRSGLLEDGAAALPVSDRKLLADQRLQILKLDGGGEIGTVDTSMLDSGIASAASAHEVRLVWSAAPEVGGYVVLRDGRVQDRLPAGSSEFDDHTVAPGHVYEYIVSPIVPEQATGQFPVWGMRVSVPLPASASESPAHAATRQAVATATATAAASTTTLSWDAFIPQAKIDAPSTGCQYGSGYQFGGDNRSWDWTSSRYRTALNAVITWSTKAVSGYTSVRATTVYKKSTGALVATKTASSSGLSAYKLGDGSGRVDIRMVNHASNPFCSFGAIDGAITFNIYQNGNWAIRSGSFRRMPNHEIYIYNGGAVTYLIKAPYQSVYCLIGPAACDSMDVTGYYGTYS